MKKFLLISIFTLLIVSICFSVTKTWVGTGTGIGKQWNQANNWSPTGVPGNGDDVIINNNTNCNVNANTALLNSITLGSGSLTFGDGMTLNIAGSFTITGGTFSPGAGIVAYRGSSQQTVCPVTYSNLTIDNESGVVLGGNVTVTGTLTISRGRISTGAYSFTRQNLTGTGIKHLLSANNYINITESGISSITIKEYANTNPIFAPPEYDITKGVKRYYQISNVTGSSGSARLRLDYFASEMGENFTPTEANVWQYRGSGPWVNQGVLLAEAYYAENNTPLPAEELAGYYTIADNNSALPVQLISFIGIFENHTVRLEWQTISEIDNIGFNVQRFNSISNSYETIGFVAGNGTTLEPQYYSFVDENPIQNPQYRLEQIDNRGLKNYFGPISLNPNSVGENRVPALFKLNQNYPNPFNSLTQISFSLANPGYTTLKVYNIIGQEVGSLFNGYAEAGKQYNVYFDAQNLTSGPYIYKLQSGDKSEVRRMILIK